MCTSYAIRLSPAVLASASAYLAIYVEGRGALSSGVRRWPFLMRIGERMRRNGVALGATPFFFAFLHADAAGRVNSDLGTPK